MRNIIQWLESGDERAIRRQADSWPIGFSLWSKDLELDFLNEALITVLVTTGHRVPRTYEELHHAIPVFHHDGRRVELRERAVVVARRESRYVESKRKMIPLPHGERVHCTIAAAPVYRHGKVWRIAGGVWTKAPEGRMLDLAELYASAALSC
jgi:hypothetical protein